MSRADTAQETQTARETRVIETALLRAAELLGLSNKDLAQITGISEASASRLKNNQTPYALAGKSRELAILFLRLFRALDSIVGGEDAVAAKWLRVENTALGSKPLEMIYSISGLTAVLAYLDARRAII